MVKRNPMSKAAKQHMDARIFRIRTVVTIFDAMHLCKVEYLTAYGSDGSARCPIHGDDNITSAYVYADSNALYCHKCQIQWDVIGLIRMMHGGKKFSFMRTLALIERRFNLPPLPSEEEFDDDDVPDTPDPELDPVRAKTKSEPKPEPVVEAQSQPEPEVIEEPDELEDIEELEPDKPELSDDAIQRLVFRHRDWINERLIEARDSVSMEYYVRICMVLDRSFGMVQRRVIDEAKLLTRLNKVLQRLYARA